LLHLWLSSLNNENQPPLERGDASKGTREVLCPRCNTYVKHGSDHTSKSLHRHQDGKPCQVGFAGEFLFCFLCFHFYILTVDLILAEEHRPRTEPSLIPSTSPPASCQGAEFWWDLSSPHLTYPFPIHDPATKSKPGYDLLSVDPHASLIHVRFLRCCSSESISVPCSSCQTLGVFVDVMKDPTTHDGRGDSPRRPRHIYSTNRSPLHFSLSPHRQRPSPAQISYNNDVFN